MGKEYNFWEDMSRVAGNAMQGLSSYKDQMEQFCKGQCEHWIHKMDLVTKEEFNVVKEGLEAMRKEQEILLNRINALENTVKK